MALSLKLAAPCLFGLESVLSSEVRKIGGENIQTFDGRVTYEGDEYLVARSNICLRTAERVGIVLGTFTATTFTQLFDHVAQLPFEDYIGKDDAFPVKGWSLKSGLHSIPDCQSIVKKAAVKRLEKVYGQSWFSETGAVHQIQFTILKDQVTLLLDTSGPGLHKRGYRAESTTTAPIKETLAAGIVDLAKIRSDSVVIDPMCGSGTLLIEAALYAYNIAPGLRRSFAAESWSVFSKDVWSKERQRAKDVINRKAEFVGIGYDCDPLAVELTTQNAKIAGVGKKITVSQQDIDALVLGDKKVTILCNPPYGERLLELEEARKLYRRMGKVILGDDNARIAIISPDEEFEDLFGRKSDKRRKLYNGMIKCQLHMFFK